MSNSTATATAAAAVIVTAEAMLAADPADLTVTASVRDFVAGMLDGELSGDEAVSDWLTVYEFFTTI